MSDPYEQVVAGMATQQHQQDPYEAAADELASEQRGHAALSVGLASNGNADQAAQCSQIAKQLHTTPQAVAAFPDDFKRFVATSQARDAFARAPVLGNYVAQHPNTAAVMHDDLPNAATLEQMSGPVMKAWQPSIGQRITQWWDGLFNLPARQRARAANQIAAQDAGMTADQEREAVGGISEMPRQAASKFLHTASFGLIPDVAGTPTTTGGEVGDIGGQLAGFFAGPMKAADWALGKVGLTKLLTAPEGASFLRAATTTAARQAATFGLAGALANTGEALNSPTLGSALHKEADAAGQNALMGGVFGATSRMFPDQTIAHFVGRFLTAQAALDAAQGQTPGVAEVNDLAHGTTDQRLQAGVNLLMNAIMSAHGAGRVTGGWVRDAARASLAEEDHAALSALSDTAAASKWRGREGESFKEFLGHVGPDADLYVSGDSFAQAMAHEGITADELRQKLPGVAEQLPGAINSESDVRIPLADYMTHIAGTPMDAQLRPEVKTDPEAMSFAEAQAFRQAKAQFSDAIDHEAQQAGESEAWRQSTRNVFDQVRSQLEASGRVGRDAAKTQALYASHFYTVLAHRLGITPEEAFEKWGASITGGEGAGSGLGQEAPGETLDQIEQDAERRGVWLETHPGDNDLTLGILDTTNTPEGRGQGVGTEFMNRLTDWADRNGKRMLLTPDTSLGASSQDRLVRFYKRFGFEENKGNDKDLETQEGMIREPRQPVAPAKLSPEDLAPKLGIDVKELQGNEYEEAARLFESLVRSRRSAPPGEIDGRTVTGARPSEAWHRETAIRASAEGKPTLVYHGSRGPLTPEKFAREALGKNSNHTTSGMGVFFTTSGVDAPQYGPHVEAVYLDIRNPARYSAAKNDLPVFDSIDDYYNFREGLRAKGHDGIIVDARSVGGPQHIIAFDPDQVIRPEKGFYQSKVDVTESPEFKKWFGDSKVVDKNGKPLVVYHGTTHDFEAFSKNNANIENDLGAAHYFSNTPADTSANYAGEGPDLTNRIEQRAERLQDEIAEDPEAFGLTDEQLEEGSIEELAREIARKELSGGAPNILPVYLSLHNPAVLGGPHETQLEVEEPYDEDTDEYGEPTGTLVDFIEGLREAARGYDDADIEAAISELYTEAAENGGSISLSDAIRTLKDSEGLQYAVDYDREGALASAEIIRQGLENAGFDGVVDNTVNDKFGSKRPVGRRMEGMDESTTHYVAFRPEQIKSAIGNRGTFSSDDPNILRQEARGMYYPDSRTIALLKDADLSTYFHEMGHAALDIYSKLATTDDAPKGVKDDVDKLMQWFGVKGETPAERLASWHALGTDGQRDYHEQFAKGTEQYLMDGKAPSHALRPLFAKVRQWLLRVYETLRHGLGVELTPEVRGVMDRMLATEDEIDAAQKARGYFDMPKPEGVDEGEWQKYKAFGQEATDEAISQMGARSVKDMQWISNAKGKAMRELQKRAANLRAGVRDEAAKEADAMPVYRAERWFTKGEMTTPEGNEVAVDQDAKGGAKLNTDAVRALYPEGIPKQLHGMTSPDGMDPELAAGMFGYPSAGSMLDDLVNREPRQSVVQGLTDRYMLERHGDLATPDAVERAAEEAIHNQARARQMATGLKVLTKSPLSRRLLEKGARDVAEETVGRQKVGDVNPRPYAAAEAKSLKEVLEAAPKDPQRAILAQRAALLNNQLYKAASDAQRDIEKAPQYFKKFSKKSIRAKLDPDVLEQVDDLLDRFDFRKYPTGAPDKKAVQLQQWMESQKAVGYTPLENPDMLNPAVRMPYREMTVEQLRGLVDTVKSMEDIARSRRKVTVDGQQMELQAVVNDLAAKMAERGDRWTDAQLAEGKRRGVDPLWRVGLDRMAGALRSAQASAKIPHFRANQFDVHEIMGPFHRYVFEPVFGANYRYVDMLQEVSKAFAEGAKSLGADWQKSLTEVVDNHRLMDNALEEPEKRRLTRGDLIGIALHVGNESNFDKLAKGMKWEPTDIWQALHDNMRAEDWEAAKLIGHVAGMHWDDEVAMNKRLGNTTPEKIEPRPFMTKFGEMPGWYAPISYDPVRSKLAVRQQDAKAVNPVDGLFGKNYYRADTTTNGSLNARIAGYYDFVNLDPKATEANIRQGLRDLAYREALVDTHKIVTHSDFRRQFLRSYGHEEYKAMLDWLGKMVNMETPEDERSNAYVQFSRTARRAVVANGIAFRISTLLKHGLAAGAKSVGYFAGGGEKYFMARAKAIGLNHKAQVVEALAKSPEIRARYYQQDRDFSRGISSLTHAETLHEKAQHFGHAGVAALDFLTAVPTFHAAYDWAVTEGIPKKLGGTGAPMETADAIKFADSVVREAHGSYIESDRSNIINSRSEMVKNLTVLYTFMNNTLGQGMDAWDKAFHSEFNKPALLARTAATLVASALAAGIVAKSPKEGHWLKWGAESLGDELAGTVPMMREAYEVVFHGWTSAGLPPWLRAVTAVGKVGKDVATSKPVKAPIKDVGNAAGLLLPGLGQAGATAQFLYDEHTGKQRAETVEQWLRGLSSGHARSP